MALPIRGASLGTPDQTADIAIRRGGVNPDRIRRYAQSLWSACARLGIRADVAFGQADYETGNRSTGIGFQSARWGDEGNPAGISIVTGMPDDTPGPVRTPEQWGIIHATHLAGYAGVEPPPEWKAMDIRWKPMIDAGYFGIAKTVDDLDGRWAVPGVNYGANLTSRWQHYNFAAQRPADVPDEGDEGRPDVAEQKAFVIAMGHRNTDRGGASNEINWTPGCARAIRDAIVARGGRAVIVQEADSDGDPNWYPGGLQAMARHAVTLAGKHGPFSAYISCHYNGGAGPGFHSIFPDAWSGVDVKANNPLDVKLCENIVAAVRKTNTVSILGWTKHAPGVMSERESGVGAQGYRLGEFYGSIGFRETTARVIIEAGSIDVARERAYINDPNWLRNVYAEAIVDGLVATFGALGEKQPEPEEPKPVDYAEAIGIAALDKYLSGDVAAMPFGVPFTFEDVQYIGLPVNDTVRVKNPKGMPRYQKPGGDGRLNPDVPHNTEFELAYRVVKVGDTDVRWGRTRWGTWIDLADVEYVAD